MPSDREPGDRRVAVVVVALATAVAAANFLLHLGTSSLFVDEVYSWGDASVPLGDLIDRLRDNEVTPPAYFAALHAWIGRLGADSDWAMRLPSAICAIALVPVLYDVGRRAVSTRAGVAAACLGALSPLVLDYAQQVRGYAPAMLVCALAAAATLRAVERDDVRWALAAGLLAALAYSIHYTTAFATAPFLGWLVLRKALPRWGRIAAAAPLAVAALALAPLLLDQLDSGRQAAISPFARLTLDNALSVLGTPWDSRAEDPDVVRWLAAAATVGGIGWLLGRGGAAGRALGLAAALPVAASFVATLVSDDALITRYTAISAPFALIAAAAAVTAGPRRSAAAVVGGALLFVAVSGTLRGHGDGARFADARAAVAAIERDGGRDDLIITPPDDVTVDLPVLYYAGRELPGATVVAADQTERLRTLLDRAQAAWFVGRRDQDASAYFERAGFESETAGRYGGTVPLALTRAVRRRPPPAVP